MQADFWHERWNAGEIGFHQAAVHPGLVAHWGALGVPAGGEVFVPLCGKSLDMHWLAEQGHRVLGVELSPLACRAFFEEAGLPCRERDDGRFREFSHGPIRLLCGDAFALTATDLRDVLGVYDRAALVALPPAMRRAYAEALAQRLPRRAPMLLVTFDYDQARMPGPPHAVPLAEVRELYAASYTTEVLFDSGQRPAPPPMTARGLDWIAEATLALRPIAA